MANINTFEYDKWKESKLPQILTNFIDDRSYFKINKNYFDTWTIKIMNKYKKKGQNYNDNLKTRSFSRIPRMYDDGYKFNWDIEWDNPTETTKLLLDPFTLEEVEEYEKRNEIYLPIELKYYLTHISRELRRYYGHLFTLNSDEKLKLTYKPEFHPFGVLKECNSISCDICSQDINEQSYYYCRFCNIDLCFHCKLENKLENKLDNNLINIEDNHQHDFRFCHRRCPEPFENACSSDYCLSKDKKYLYQYPFYYYCWECEEYYCPDCISADKKCPQEEEEESFWLNSLFEFNPKQITQLETDNLLDNKHPFIKYINTNHNLYINEKFIEMRSSRHDNGCLVVGEPGCGIKDTIVLNGSYKGRILTFLVDEYTHTLRYTESLFEYLCHEWD